MSPATWIISVGISGSISGYNHRWTEAHAINVNIKNVPSRMSFTQCVASSPLSFLISINHIFSSLTPQRLNFFWSQSTITILCIIGTILLTSMAVVTALINVLGYNRLVSGGNKTLCKHNREPPYLPATMSIRVKMMGETIF